jgi:hypothetical protein
MIFGYFTLISALIISGIAAYYSIIGLTAIFAAALVPIIVMGVALELGKVVSAVWLHRNWHQARIWMRGYLTFATIVLMFITSMGIFGFLSKAHIEQTSASQESVAQIERIVTEIARQNSIIERSDNKIKKLETTGTGTDANIQSQIDKEQKRIDSAYSRVKPAIDEQQLIIDSQAEIYKTELQKIDNQLLALQSYIEAGEIKKAQQMVGSKADGQFGPKTAKAFTEFQERKTLDRSKLLTKIENSINNERATAAREEIKRLRKSVETQIADSNNLIKKLRNKISAVDTNDNIEDQIDGFRLKITDANKKIDELTEQKYTIETEYRKLEAEVGPVKYIAEFIYGETADRTMLEDAVRWVIVILVLVFDPLAICLILAGTQQIVWGRRLKAESVEKPDDHPDPEPEEETDHDPEEDVDQQEKHLDADEVSGEPKRLQLELDQATSDLHLAAELAAEFENRNQQAETRIAELESALAQAEGEDTSIEDTIIEEIEVHGVEIDEPEYVAIDDELEETDQQPEPSEKFQNTVWPEELDDKAIEEIVIEDVKSQDTEEQIEDTIEVLQDEVLQQVSDLESDAPDETIEQYVEPTTLLDGDSSATTGPLSEEEKEEVELQLKTIDYQRGTGKVLQASPLFEAKPDNTTVIQSGFGSMFPNDSNVKRGDMFLRTDYLPSRLFKFNGDTWIETSKTLSNSYVYDTKYVEYLIDKLQTGEYELEDLEDQEQEQIRDYLQNV